MSNFKTDGFVVSDGDGYMGIFSTVSLLNDKCKKVKELELVIANTLHNIINSTVISDTLWHSDIETLADYLSNALGEDYTTGETERQALSKLIIKLEKELKETK